MPTQLRQPRRRWPRIVQIIHIPIRAALRSQGSLIPGGPVPSKNGVPGSHAECVGIGEPYGFSFRLRTGWVGAAVGLVGEDSEGGVSGVILDEEEWEGRGWDETYWFLAWSSAALLRLYRSNARLSPPSQLKPASRQSWMLFQPIICICICVCVCVYVCVDICVGICVCVCMRLRICICMCICGIKYRILIYCGSDG
jgi:hypothetical protein